MIRKKIALIIVLSLLTPVFVTAQTQDKQDSAKQEPAKTEEDKKAREEMEKKALALVDEIIKELQSLRLPENRIRVQSRLGDLLWKRDERRARLLFKQAVDGLAELAAQTGSPLNVTNQETIQLMQIREQLKQEVINLIAQRDPKYARDILRSMRTPSQNQYANAAQYEMDPGQELRLASQIAVTDPAQALQMAEESISGGLKMELIGVFSQIAEKDREMGTKLLTSIMKSLRTTNMSENDASASFALSLLQMGIGSVNNNQESEGEGEVKIAQAPKPATNNSSVMDEKTIKELIEMLAAAALGNAKPSKADEDGDNEGFESYLIRSLNGMIRDIEKYAPSRAAQINKKIAALNKKLPPEEKFYEEQQRVISEGTVDEILESVSKAPAELKDSFYQQAASKALNQGDESLARQIVNEHVSNPYQREQFLKSLNDQAMWTAAAQGKIEETRQMLNRIPLEQRAEVLMRLAGVIASKGEKKIALQLLDEARGMIGPQPANHNELRQMLSISNTYSSLEVTRSFEIIEPIVDQLNTLIAAAAVIDGFDYMRYFRDGELIPQNSGLLTAMAMLCVNEIGVLAKIEFDRAKLAADRFQRSELRIFARLQVADRVLSDNLGAQFVPSMGRGGPQ
jgi:hypothetical protein